MGVEAIPNAQGASRAGVVCDDCGRKETVACAYTKTNPKGAWSHNQKSGVAMAPNEAQARANAIKLGWAYVKNKLRCGACEAKRKANNMSVKNVTKLEPKKAPERTCSQKDWVQIVTMLAEVYDIDQGRYMQGDTDDTVASVLGVMPGWVAEIREEKFGPDGGNEDIEALTLQVASLNEEVDAALKSFASIQRTIDRLSTSGKTMSEQLAKIRKAVGPRVEKKAGI